MELLNIDHPQTVLVIEDKISFAQRLMTYLESKGHTVFGYAGVDIVDGNELYGRTPLSEKTPASLDLKTIQLCFLDHYFEGEDYDGTKLTKVLVPMGIKVCGMSSVDHANFSMLRYGAVCAYRKDFLARMLSL